MATVATGKNRKLLLVFVRRVMPSDSAIIVVSPSRSVRKVEKLYFSLPPERKIRIVWVSENRLCSRDGISRFGKIKPGPVFGTKESTEKLSTYLRVCFGK